MSTPVSFDKVYLFKRLSGTRLEEVRSLLTEQALAKDEVLFNMGDAGDALYIITSGEVAIFVPDEANPGKEKPIRIFQAGDAMGEMALIDHEPRSASARAVTDASLLKLGEADFRRLISADEDFAFAVMNGLNDRVRYTTNFLSQVRMWVTKISQGEYTSNDQFLAEVDKWVADVGRGEDKDNQALAALAAEFARMTSNIKEREDTLRKEIVQLKIEIDQQKRNEEVSSIVETDMFRQLQEKAKRMREERDDD